jgi:hypothetical protein
MKPSNSVLDWLLQGEPYIEYRTRVDLLGQPESESAVAAARQAMLDSAPVRALVEELSGWPGVVISSHKSAGQPFHKLTFLADLGLKAGDPGVGRIVERILAHQSAEGLFQLSVNIPVHFGGSGRDEWGWALCDAPLSVYALAKFGLAEETPVKKAADYLAGLVRENGWPCAVSKELGRFRGPGRKDDPCPDATLIMLKLLAELDGFREGPACQAGTEALLGLWADSLTRHPYIFYMGTDFRKLKVPFIWYDLLHVLEVLSPFPWVRKDPRFLDMLAVLQGKADEEGRFTGESVWTAWKEWEFGQKKQPSRWLTLLAWRIIGRVGLNRDCPR